MTKDKKPTKWEKEDIFKLPLNLQRVLQVFIGKKTNLLTFQDIATSLGAKVGEGKGIGGSLAGFSKIKKKDPLVQRISREEWLLNSDYRELVVKSLNELNELRKKAKIK